MVIAKLEAQRKAILHFWMNGIHSSKEIHEISKIPLRTIQRNLKRLKETGTIEYKGGSGRPSKVTRTFACSIGQVIRHNSVVSTRQLAIKLRETHSASISHPTVWRHIKKKDYKSSVPV